MLEHFNNAYSRHSQQIGGANPFLCHPDEVKYRQYGALISDTLAEKELVHAGTPFEVDLKAHTAKIMKVWEVVKVEDSSTSGSKVITLNASWLAPKLVSTDIVMKVPATIDGTGKGLAAGTVTDNGDGTVSITVVAANFDVPVAGDFLTIAAAAGSSKSLKVQPNGYLYNDIYLGDLDDSAAAKSAKTIAATGAVVKFHKTGLLVDLTPSALVKAQMAAAVPGVLQVEV